MPSLFLLGLLVVAAIQAPAPAAAPAATTAAADELSAEVQRAVTAYNARDLKYYESVLDPKSVYIAEDGAVISGRERVLRTFGRIFSAEPPRRIESRNSAWTGAETRAGRRSGGPSPRAPTCARE